jgi:hypothetical protein
MRARRVSLGVVSLLLTAIACSSTSTNEGEGTGGGGGTGGSSGATCAGAFEESRAWPRDTSVGATWSAGGFTVEVTGPAAPGHYIIDVKCASSGKTLKAGLDMSDDFTQCVGAPGDGLQVVVVDVGGNLSIVVEPYDGCAPPG